MHRSLAGKEGATSTPEFDVALDADGYCAHCDVAQRTAEVLEKVKANKIELQAGDVAVCATQLWDIEILNIRTEAKTGYDPSSLGRPMRVSADHDLLIEELTKRGVLIAYAKLTEHPELQEGTAAAGATAAFRNASVEHSRFLAGL